MAATTLTPTVIATVVSVQGEAYARNAEGDMRLLKAGDALFEGETVVTRAGGQVELAFADGHMMAVLPNETFLLTPEVAEATRPAPEEAAVSTADIQKVIQAIEQGLPIDEQLAAAAAGVTGGGENAGHSFVRLLRIAEGIEPLAYQFPYPREVVIREPEGVVTEEVPTPAVTLTGVQLDVQVEPVFIKEDADEDEGWGGAQVLVNASTNEGSHLTQIVITGFKDGGWDYDFTSLGTEGVDWTYSAGTLTILNLGGTSYTGTFMITALPDDSDVDLGTLLAVATAVSDTDPTVSATASDTLDVNVDAVLDDSVELGPPNYASVVSAEEVVSGTLSLGIDGAYAVNPYPYSGAGGQDEDGSESGTVIITLNGLPGGASLATTAPGVTVVTTATGYTLMGWSDVSELAAAINGLQVVGLPEGWTGTISGSISVSFVDTPSDATNEAFDNTDSDATTFSVTVTSIEPATERVSEEGLAGPVYFGIPDGVGNQDTTNATYEGGTLSLPSVEGLSVTLSAPVGNFYSNGVLITWTGGGTQLLTGSAGGTDIVTITIDDSGNYSVTLSGPIDHLFAGDVPATAEDDLSFVVTVNATDGLQNWTGALTVVVEDDMPTVSAVRTAFMTNEVDLSLTDTIPSAFGGDGAGGVTLSGSNSGGYWIRTDSGHEGEALTSNGTPLLYVINLDGSLEARVEGTGQLIFTVTYNPDGTYTVHQVGPLDGATVEYDVGLTTEHGGGHHEDAYFTDYSQLDPDTGKPYVVIFAEAFTDYARATELPVNFNHNAVGVDEGDKINPDEVLYLSLTDGSAYAYDSGKVDTDNLPGTMTYMLANEVTVSYWNLQDNDTPVIQVWKHVDGSLQLVSDSPTVTDNGDGTYTITNGGAFDTVTFAYSGTGNGYGVANMSGELTETGYDQSVLLTATVADADADTATISWNFSFDGDGDGMLKGTTGDDIIQGNSGDDTLSGLSGSDILIGDGGADVFVWQLADGDATTPPTDVVKDFGSGDVLNLADLLSTGYSVTNVVQNESGPGPIGTTIEVQNTSSQLVQTIFLEGYTAGDAANILNELNTHKTYTSEA